MKRGDHDIIYFINRSEHSVYFVGTLEYPDTSMTGKGYGCDEFIEPFSSCKAIGGKHGWEDLIGSNAYGVAMFFVTDRDTNIKYGLDTVLMKNLYLKRYELTVEDLNNSYWTIIYPYD